jgi:two-component sensor histidine kinase
MLTPIKHASGAVEALVFALTDVTDQVQMREKLLDVERSRTSLAKSMATEIGHRTKNNLQIVAGILQMQVHNQGDRPLSLDLVQDAISRIRIFAMLQQQMYETQTDTIELLDAAQRIANINRESQSQDDLAITIEGEPLPCSAAAGTNLCVMINELITNAIKYGAADGAMRKIVIRISRREGMLSLSVWNSGNPIPADFDIQKRARVGLDLIRNLAMFHFGGSFELSPQQGGTLARIVIDDNRLREST